VATPQGMRPKTGALIPAGTTDVIPAVQHIVFSLRLRGAIPLLRPCVCLLQTFVQNQMATLVVNSQLEST